MKTRKDAPKKRQPAFFIPREDLTETSRALYGLAQTYEAEGAEQGYDSIDGPFHESGDSDVHAWLNEHRGWLDQ